jgi:hypothetical protein
MHIALLVMGLGKILFGIVVGAARLFIASRMLGRILGWGASDDEIRKGNVAAAALEASSLVSFGIRGDILSH